MATGIPGGGPPPAPTKRTSKPRVAGGVKKVKGNSTQPTLLEFEGFKHRKASRRQTFPAVRRSLADAFEDAVGPSTDSKRSQASQDDASDGMEGVQGMATPAGQEAPLEELAMTPRGALFAVPFIATGNGVAGGTGGAGAGPPSAPTPASRVGGHTGASGSGSCLQPQVSQLMTGLTDLALQQQQNQHSAGSVRGQLQRGGAGGSSGGGSGGLGETPTSELEPVTLLGRLGRARTRNS